MKKLFYLLFVLVITANISNAQPPALLNQNYKLVYRDDFDNGVVAPWGADNETEHGGDDCEKQVYLAKNVTESEGWLHIKAMKEDYTCVPYTKTASRTFKYTSGQVISPMNLTYGYFEIRCGMPEFKGSWPAFWLIKGKEGKEYQEIDIFEACGATPDKIKCGTYQEYTTKKVNGECQFIKDNDGIDQSNKKDTRLPNSGYTKIPKTSNFNSHINVINTYGVEWTPTKLKWFINGIEIFEEQNINLFDPEHIILNLAIDGGCWCNKDCGNSCVDDDKLPASYDIDYVKIWQKEKQNIYIKGSKDMCRGKTETFFAPYYANAFYEWSSSSGLTVTPSVYGWENYPYPCPYFKEGWQSTNVTATQAGQQTLTLKVSFSGGYTETTTYDIFVSDGVPATPNSVNFVQDGDGCSYNGTIVGNGTATSYVMIKNGVSVEFQGPDIPSNFKSGKTKFSVYAKNSCGLSKPLNVNETLDKLPECQKWQLKISPNPGNTYINIDIERNNEKLDANTMVNGEIYIRDFFGNLKKQERLNETQKSIDISDLENGIYNIMYRDEFQVVTELFVKTDEL